MGRCCVYSVNDLPVAFSDGLGPLVNKLDSMVLEAGHPGGHSKKRAKHKRDNSSEGRPYSSSNGGQQQGGPHLLWDSSGGGWGQPTDPVSRLVKGLTTTNSQRPGSAGSVQMWSSNSVHSRPMTAAGMCIGSPDASGSGATAAVAAAGHTMAGSVTGRQRPQSAAAGISASGGGAGSGMRKPGSLVAAGILWQRTNDSCFRPPLRQCLTYEEMVTHNK